MAERPIDPLQRKDEADLVLERAADRLRALLRDAARELDPFPPFPGSFFTLAIEVEPGPAASPDRGCVVVCPDGELRELLMGVDLEDAALSGWQDPVSMRKEELREIQLHPRDYIVYAYEALTRITELLLERQGEAGR
ncbi:MAG TPA: hypothetical protein VIO14_08025 [Dehalococcoidia bacterium]